MQMVIWGFLSQFLATNSSYVASSFGVLISGVMLWDVLFRGQLGFSRSLHRRTLVAQPRHLYCSPLTPLEHILALVAMVVPARRHRCVPAMPAGPFRSTTSRSSRWASRCSPSSSICSSWAAALGLLVTAMILRYGLAAENMAWFLVFFLAPFSCAYYPVTVLPGWAQVLAHSLPRPMFSKACGPCSFHGTFLWDHFFAAVGSPAALPHRHRRLSLQLCAGTQAGAVAAGG